MESAALLLINGRYRIGPLLGEGAMATVSQATDTLLDRPVAVKILKPAFAQDERLVQRFQAEARAAARLVDPNVVAIYDVIPAQHAFVMELVNGPNLATIIAREGRLPEHDVVRYARQIAHALAVAHVNGIVHRDVKPANVLIGPGDVAKVADFGLAKALQSDDASLTETGRLVGSAAYFSPEQAQGLPLTPASDLYSLGVVIYQEMTGSLPFQASSPIGSAIAHVTAPAPSEAELARSMSPALARVVHRLLQKDPAARYASASELDTDLAAIADVPPLDADAPTIVGGIPKVARLRRRPAFRAAAILAAAIAAIAAVAAQLRPAAAHLEAFSQRLRANPRLRSVNPAAAFIGFAIVLAVLAAIVTRPHAAPPARVAAQPAAPHAVATTAHTAIVPNVHGMSLATAGAAMRRAGLVPTFAARVANASPNVVVEQYPAAGTPLRPQATTLVVISAGPQPRIIYTQATAASPAWIPPGRRKHHHLRGDGGDGGD
ncbi:MAG TPA: protein kinase [Candidatus Elarobacter sp.]